MSVLTRGRMIAVWGVVLVVLVAWRAAPAAGQETKPADANGQSIGGIVQDEKGQPVADAQIDFAINDDRATARSGADGRFTIPPAKEKRRAGTLVARSADGKLQGFLTTWGAPRAAGTQPSKPRLDDLHITLKPAREFPITVVDANEKPVAGAWIAFSSDFVKTAEATTDADGHALLRVPADAPAQHIVAVKGGVGLDYFVVAPKDWKNTDPYHLDRNFAGPIKFVLNGVTPVTVKVVDDKNQPIAGVSVHPWYFMKPRKGADFNHGLRELFRKTDDQGVATFDFIPSDNTQGIQFWTRLDGWSTPSRTMYEPTKGQATLQATLQATMVRLIHVAGRVTDEAGHGVAGAKIHATGECYEIDHFETDGIISADDGSFAIDVSPEMYYMFAANKEKLVSPAQTRMIHKDAPSPIELKLQPGQRVFGRIAAGSDNTPIKKAYVRLIRYDEGTYYKLPKDQQFPGGTTGRKWIAPQYSLYMDSDDQGRFEFYTAPGKHALFCYTGGEQVSQSFAVSSEPEKEVDLHAAEARSGPRMISGRVVLRDKPETTVSEATIEGVDAKLEMMRSEGTSDRQGNFNVQRGASDLYLYAVSLDKKLSGVALVKSSAPNATIEVGPTAKARGRLLDWDGKPIADRQIEYGVRVGPAKGPWQTCFGGHVQTSADGAFNVEGLVPGFDYEVSAVLEMGDSGQPRSWHTLKSARADRADQTVELGELKMSKPYVPPTTASRVARLFEKKEPIAERFEKGKHFASAYYQNVIVVLTSPERRSLNQFYEMWRDLEIEDVGEVYAGFVTMFVNVKSPAAAEIRSWADTHGVAWPSEAGTTFAAFDTTGKLLGQASYESLSDQNKLQRAKVMAFGKANGPVLPDAQVLLNGALADAKRQGKRVLLDQCGASCIWCMRLDDYFQANRALIDKDYVLVRIDARMQHGREIIKSLRTVEHSAGVPWMAILDADGKVLISGDNEHGNIGYPNDAESQTHLEKMLRTTATHLSDADVKALIKWLQLNATSS